MVSLKPLAKLYGKEPPPLKVTDARGVDKNLAGEPRTLLEFEATPLIALAPLKDALGLVLPPHQDVPKFLSRWAIWPSKPLRSKGVTHVSGMDPQENLRTGRDSNTD